MLKLTPYHAPARQFQPLSRRGGAGNLRAVTLVKFKRSVEGMRRGNPAKDVAIIFLTVFGSVTCCYSWKRVGGIGDMAIPARSVHGCVT